MMYTTILLSQSQKQLPANELAAGTTISSMIISVVIMSFVGRINAIHETTVHRQQCSQNAVHLLTLYKRVYEHLQLISCQMMNVDAVPPILFSAMELQHLGAPTSACTLSMHVTETLTKWQLLASQYATTLIVAFTQI